MNKAKWTVVATWWDHGGSAAHQRVADGEAIGGTVRAVEEPAKPGWPTVLAAEIEIEARTVLQAVTAALAKVNRGIPGCDVTDVHAKLQIGGQ